MWEWVKICWISIWLRVSVCIYITILYRLAKYKYIQLSRVVVFVIICFHIQSIILSFSLHTTHKCIVCIMHIFDIKNVALSVELTPKCSVNLLQQFIFFRQSRSLRTSCMVFPMNIIIKTSITKGSRLLSYCIF